MPTRIMWAPWPQSNSAPVRGFTCTPADGAAFDVACDLPLADGDWIALGESTLRCIHTPGHTSGMICFDLGDGRIVVGDTLFVGGPGRTWSAADFATTMRTMQEIVFLWPDETEFFPGHGASGRIGSERPAFTAFCGTGLASGFAW
jgi:hydroxyacylglutathione hydrolase